MIRLLIADDHELFREGLKSLLKSEDDIELVGSASDGLEAVNMTEELHPDVILMDVTMPNINGIQATEKIIAQDPGIAIIVISMHSDRRFIAETLKAGAKGYLLKESSPQAVLDAIRSVTKGDIFLSTKACTVLVKDYLRLLDNEAVNKVNPLSEREMEVLHLFVKGYNGKQIAEYLSISKNTVDTHRRRIMDKLGCASMVELTKYAIREGFLTLE
ncbi:MAG: response regulator transcription factor [Synergistaceae bacterium]|nr:response regulator transcription factor [Synergistaceae bacterium]